MAQSECPVCSETKQSLGKHWARSAKCDYPDLFDEEKSLLDSLLIGDGTLDRYSDKNNRLSIGVIREEYIDYLAEKLDWLVADKYVTSPEGVRRNNKYYKINTICHPFFNQMEERWYPNGEKFMPDTLQITPTFLTHWICQDGNLSWNQSGTARYKLGNIHFGEREEFFTEKFKDLGFNVVITNYELGFSSKDTDNLRRFMGGPLPGYEYKWAENKAEYDKKKHL